MTPEIRLLSLTQPWAQLVALRRKQVETRSRGTKYRGWVAIHAAKGFEASCWSLAERWGLKFPELPLGKVLCLAYLAEVYPTDTYEVYDPEREYGDYSPGRKAWVFGAVALLPTPYPYKGAQGLRALPPNVAGELLGLAGIR